MANVLANIYRPERKHLDLLSIPPGTEMFHFPGYAPHIRAVTVVDSGVSPFGYFRIADCLASPRNFSQPYHVLHRFLKPRHPPYALNIPVRNVRNRFLCFLYTATERTKRPVSLKRQRPPLVPVYDVVHHMLLGEDAYDALPAYTRSILATPCVQICSCQRSRIPVSIKKTALRRLRDFSISITA